MINDLEKAILAHIKDKKVSQKEALKKLGFTDSDAINAVASFGSDTSSVSNLQWLGLCGYVINYTINSMRKKKYDQVLIGLEVASVCLNRSNEGDNIRSFLSSFGKANAIKRHSETYQLKDEVITYWTKNIDPKTKNDKAADLLIKIFPLSHRKLSQYVAEAKKIHHPRIE